MKSRVVHILFFLLVFSTTVLACEYAYLGEHKAMIIFDNKQKMFVNTEDIGIVPHLIAQCDWEPWEWKVIEELINPGDNVIEIGSNFGFYTLKIASKIGNAGKLYAFEASPKIFPILNDTITVNGLTKIVSLINKAVFDQIGEMQFVDRNGNNMGGSHLSFQKDQSKEVINHGIVNVPVVNLDNQFSAQDKINLIKIDAEGSECKILSGASRLLAESDITLVLEWSKEMQASSGADVSQCITNLEKLHYQIYKINLDSSISKIDRKYLLGSQELFDIILTKKKIK